MKVRIWNYGDYSSSNYGSSRAVTIGDLDLYFSYDTVIAFQNHGDLVITKNQWSTTTGRHLNCINRDKKIRVPYEDFKKKLNDVLEKHDLI